MLRHIVFIIATILLMASATAIMVLRQNFDIAFIEVHGIVVLFSIFILWGIVTAVMFYKDYDDVWAAPMPRSRVVYDPLLPKIKQAIVKFLLKHMTKQGGEYAISNRQFNAETERANDLTA